MSGTEIKVDGGQDIEGQQVLGYDGRKSEDKDSKEEEGISGAAVEASGHQTSSIICPAPIPYLR